MNGTRQDNSLLAKPVQIQSLDVKRVLPAPDLISAACVRSATPSASHLFYIIPKFRVTDRLDGIKETL